MSDEPYPPPHTRDSDSDGDGNSPTDEEKQANAELETYMDKIMKKCQTYRSARNKDIAKRDQTRLSLNQLGEEGGDISMDTNLEQKIKEYKSEAAQCNPVANEDDVFS